MCNKTMNNDQEDYGLYDRNEEYLNFMDFISTNQNNVVAINTDREEDTRVLEDINDFFKVYNIDVGRIDMDFISCVYIDFGLEDRSRINVIFKVNGINKRFTFEVVEEC